MMKKESNKIFKLGKGIEVFFSTFPNYIKISMIISILIIISFSLPIKVLLAQDFKTGEYLKSWKIKGGERFTVEYTHSVQLTPVTETYIIQKKDIILIETVFHSYGAGLPATTPYKFEMTKDGFRIYDIFEKMTNLIYRTGAERANHRLICGDKKYEFLNFSKPRTGVELKVGKMNVFSYIIREGFN